jgi:hypothetical protein
MIVRRGGLLGLMLCLALAGHGWADTSPPSKTPEMRVVSTVVDVDMEKIAAVKVAAPSDIPGTFDIKVVLETIPEGGLKATSKQAMTAAAGVTLGRGRASIPAGQRATVKVRLNRGGRAHMKRAEHHRLRALAVVTGQLGNAAPSTTHKPVTMRG